MENIVNESTKLYDLPMKAGVKIRLFRESGLPLMITFDHLDGMYSYSTVDEGQGEDSGKIVHLSGGTPLIKVGDHYEIAAQQNLTLGDMVTIRSAAPMGGGERAYVYDTYADFDEKGELGVSVITESGVDTGGWSRAEQRQWFEPIEQAPHHRWDYEFKNVIQLAQDFRDGVFDRVFKQ